jgi:hypothetical protein
MPLMLFSIMANFIAPENIGTDPKSMLWLLPLTAAIAIVYKATKMSKITAGSFIKEAAILSGSIIIFIIIIALALFGLAWMVTG